MALKIAGDSIVPTAHIASTKWMLKQGLYEYLQTDSSLSRSWFQQKQAMSKHSITKYVIKN